MDNPVMKNLKALQGALEHSLTIQRTRLQEIVDDLVARGSITRADADGLVAQLLSSSKDYTQALLKVLEPAMASAGRTAGRIAGTVLQAPRLVARSSEPSDDPAFDVTDPIPDYDRLTVAQIRPKLADLAAADLRRLQAREQAGKARKGVLEQIDQLLGPK